MPGDSLVCRVCGIMATSEPNLEDNYLGRRHQRNLQRSAQQCLSLALGPWPALLLIATTSTALRRRQHQHQQRPRCSTRSPPRPRGAASFASQSVKGPASYLKYGMTSVTRLD